LIGITKSRNHHPNCLAKGAKTFHKINFFTASDPITLLHPLQLRVDSKVRDRYPLTMLLLLTDLEQLGQTALQDFGRDVARTDGTDKGGLERHAQRLEAKLEQLYAVAATMAQREENLDGVTAIWSGMVSICDRMAKALSDLHQGRKPALESYDRILEIRNACEDNRALHA